MSLFGKSLRQRYIVLYNNQATGCGAVWLARLLGVQEAAGSSPVSPTTTGYIRTHSESYGCDFLFLVVWQQFDKFRR